MIQYDIKTNSKIHDHNLKFFFSLLRMALNSEQETSRERMQNKGETFTF